MATMTMERPPALGDLETNLADAERVEAEALTAQAETETEALTSHALRLVADPGAELQPSVEDVATARAALRQLGPEREQAAVRVTLARERARAARLAVDRARMARWGTEYRPAMRALVEAAGTVLPAYKAVLEVYGRAEAAGVRLPPPGLPIVTPEGFAGWKAALEREELL